MALDSGLTVIIVLGLIVILLSIVRLAYMMPVLRVLRKRHNDAYLKYFPDDAPVGLVFATRLFSPLGMNIARVLLFTNRLNLDNELGRHIRKFRAVSYIHILSLLALLASLAMFIR
ncbi:MAG: hypothetical protein R6U32_03995 [Candidatus Woesearchaeota archaeon]